MTANRMLLGAALASPPSGVLSAADSARATASSAAGEAPLLVAVGASTTSCERVAPGSGTRLHCTSAATAKSSAVRFKSPLLGGVGDEIAERAELRRLGHAGAVLVVRRLFRILAKRAK